MNGEALTGRGYCYGRIIMATVNLGRIKPVLEEHIITQLRM